MKKNKHRYKKPILSIHGDLKDITKAGYGPGTDYRDDKGDS